MPQCGDSNGDSYVKGLITMAKITAKGLEKLMRELAPKRTPLGDGLYFTITKGGSASFSYRYQIKGKRRQIGLGAFCPVNNTLGIARTKALNAQAMVRQNIDPLEQIKLKEKQKEDDLVAQKNLKKMEQATFEVLAAEYIKNKSPEWKNPKHRQQWHNTLVTYAFPFIGKMPVSAIETTHILKVLTPIWRTKTETATRVRTRMELILDYAKFHKWRSGSNPARWRGHLQTSLPNPGKIRKVKHHPALPYTQVAQFIKELGARRGIGARALEICILHGNRTKEIRMATWDQFDLEARVWTVPAKNMKKGIEHRIPLSRQAIKMLESLSSHITSDYVFSNHYSDLHLSESGMSSALNRMNKDGKWKDKDGEKITVHGFRSTFRDYVAEQTNTPQRTAEHALAHGLKDASEAAYQRGDLIQKREILMQQWADYCYPSGAKVIQMPTVKSVS
jgi:integrase